MNKALQLHVQREVLVPYFFMQKKEEKELIKSLITGREYAENNCVYVTNMLQAQKYLAHLGPQYLLDILYTGTYRKDSLVFVFERCPETRRAKELWDNHELN